MTHLKDKTKDGLQAILVKCHKKKIPYSITQKNGVITELRTNNKELLDYARKQNGNLQ